MWQQERKGHSALYKTHLEIVAKKIEAGEINIDDDIPLKKDSLMSCKLYALASGKFLIVK